MRMPQHAREDPPHPPPPRLTRSMLDAAMAVMVMRGGLPGCVTGITPEASARYRSMVVDIWAAMHTASLVDSPLVEVDRWSRKYLSWTREEIAVLQRHIDDGDTNTREWGERELPGRSLFAIRARFWKMRNDDPLSDMMTTRCECCNTHFRTRDPDVTRSCLACRVSGRAASAGPLVSGSVRTV